MAYNQELASRIRKYLEPLSDKIEEKKMFGGLSFLYLGKMSVGIVKDRLAVRVISPKYEKSLKMPHVIEMTFTGKAMKDFLYVDPPGFESEAQLAEWIELGIEHAEQNSKN